MKRILLMFFCVTLLSGLGLSKQPKTEGIGHPDDSPWACASFVLSKQKDVGSRDMYYSLLSNLYANRNQIDQAMFFINVIEEDDDKDGALISVISGLSANGQYEKAVNLLDKIKNPYLKAYALVCIGRCYAHDQNEKSATSFLKQALDLTRKNQNGKKTEAPPTLDIKTEGQLPLLTDTK